MKRTLLIGTAALAFAATPAVAQMAEGQGNVTTETDITTDVPETAMETGTDVTTSVQTEVGDKVDDMPGKSAEAKVKGEMQSEAGVGGDYYESEEDAAAKSDLNTGADVDVSVDTPDVNVPEAKAETGADVEVETRTGTDDGMGGPAADNREDAAARYGDLNAVAAGNASADMDGLETEGLNEYTLNQIKEAGPEAVEDVDTLDAGDLDY